MGKRYFLTTHYFRFLLLAALGSLRWMRRASRLLQRLSRLTGPSPLSGKICPGWSFISLHQQTTVGAVLGVQPITFPSFYSLKDNRIRDEGAKAIAEALKVNITIAKLE